jgi:hypothetical protein
MLLFLEYQSGLRGGGGKLGVGVLHLTSHGVGHPRQKGQRCTELIGVV